MTRTESTVRLALTTPVVMMHPGSCSDWELDASIEDLARVAQLADRLGYHHMTCAEHVAMPQAELGRRGSRYWDPLPTFGYLAACTERLRFATNVVVLPYHHPLQIAKQYGTLDKISHGRVILGVGVGSLKEEFDLLGAPFDDRGLRSDDALRALRASLSRDVPAYHGDFYSFEQLVVDPCAVQDRVPLWVGGQSLRSLRRAVSLADGWCPFNVSLDQVRNWLSRFELAPGFEVVLWPPRPLDPINDPQQTLETLAEIVECGATMVRAEVVHRSLEEYLDCLRALAELVAAPTPQ